MDRENGDRMTKAMQFAYDEMNEKTDDSRVANNQRLSRFRGESSVDDGNADNRIDISNN